jgi:hypothetical protein
MDILLFLLLVAPFLLNVSLLYKRRNKTGINQYKWYLALALFFIGTVLFWLEVPVKRSNDFIIWSELMTILIFLLVDLGFSKLSYLLHKRDFYLNLRNAHEKIERNLKLEGNIKFKTSDTVFSILLILMAGVLEFLPFFVESLH